MFKTTNKTKKGTTMNFKQKFYFTNKEQEILIRLASGVSNKKIANSMNIKEGTVKIHMKNMFKKTGSRNRIELLINTNILKKINGVF